MLSPDRMERLRQALVDERDRLQSDVATMETGELATDEEIGVGNHMADDATEVFNQESQLSLRLSQQLILADVEHALERMDEGTYGTCERCGQEIDFARLKARPYARYCMACQRIVEG